MREVKHTLYITAEDGTLSYENHNIRLRRGEGEELRIPLLPIERLLVSTDCPVSNELMAYCAEQGIGLYFLDGTGKLRFSVCGESSRGAALRRKQYLLTEERRTALARSLIEGKLVNQRRVLTHFASDHPPAEELRTAAEEIGARLETLRGEQNAEVLRGIEGAAAGSYFSAFPHMLLTTQPEFAFDGRNRRPPEDRINALLSLAYGLLKNDCLYALQCAGLDAYCGLLHGDRAGRPSLALDLMEELRPVMADRFVLRLVNLRMLTPELLQRGENGFTLTAAGGAVFFREWSHMHRRTLHIDGVEEELSYGQLPHLQAQRLADAIRDEFADYVPLKWR